MPVIANLAIAHCESSAKRTPIRVVALDAGCRLGPSGLPPRLVATRFTERWVSASVKGGCLPLRCLPLLGARKVGVCL